jgi:hypothetical protein
MSADSPRIGHSEGCGRNAPCPVELSVVDAIGHWGLTYFCSLDCLLNWLNRKDEHR